MTTPRRPLAEKIMAVVGTYVALGNELVEHGLIADDPIVQAELLRTSLTLALASDTKDLGLLVPAPKRQMSPEDSPP